MLSLIGLLIVITVVALLLSNRASPIVALTLIPVIGTLLAGFDLNSISHFFNDGLDQVISIATMFIFAILYFGIMQDVGLFDPLIQRVIALSSGNVIAIAMGTVIIGALAHLDGSGASTFLITIPALLPIYQRLKMSPYLLVLLVGASASIMNMVPWGGPLGRAASTLENTSSVELWHTLIPLQIMALFILLGLAALLGWREKKRIDVGFNQTNNLLGQPSFNTEAPSDLSMTTSRHWWFNLGLTSLLIISLVSSWLPVPLTFMIGLTIALIINFPNPSQQTQRIKAHAPNALMMAAIILAAGVFLGMMQGSGMLKQLAIMLVAFLPNAMLPYLHLIIGVLGAPFELLLNTDAYYYALLPIVQSVSQTVGITPHTTTYALLVGNIVGTFISPFSPALWLALGLAGIEMGRYIRYAFLWIWGFSIILFIIAGLMGLF